MSAVRPPKIGRERYKKEMHPLQIELVKFQRAVIAEGRRVLIIAEGRDAAGKDGLIKRITTHMAPRETSIVALGKPSDHNRTLWYFQRYVAHLPAAQEIVLFNRSWYNRAGVERVMGFCSDQEYEAFMRTVSTFETMLADSGIQLFQVLSRHRPRRAEAAAGQAQGRPALALEGEPDRCHHDPAMERLFKGARCHVHGHPPSSRPVDDRARGREICRPA